MNTLLDRAYATMMDAGESEAARTTFFATLRAAELFILLEAEPVADQVQPKILTTSDGDFALAFDTEARLAEFIDTPSPYLGLSGRRVAALLTDAGVGLGFNLGVAPSAILLPAEAMSWINDNAPAPVDIRQARPQELSSPGDLPPVLLSALDACLAQLQGLGQAAYLAQVRFDEQDSSHILVLTGVISEAEAAIADAVAEALHSCGLDTAELDVAFLDSDAAILKSLEAVALRINLPKAAVPQTPRLLDPNVPPKLR